MPHLPSKKSLVRILAIFFETLNNELANWQTIILVSSFLVTAITISAFSAPAFSKTVGNVALPTIPFTSRVSLIFLISSDDWSITVTEWPWAQGHSVTVIDQSSEDIKKISDTLDVKGIVGRATLPTVLENAGAEKADMVIAVTRNDETNMIVCQLASSLFNVSKKIARIRTKDFLEGKWGKLAPFTF